MPCHVPATSVSRRRPPSLRLSPPKAVAVLDLAQPGERDAHDFLRRFTTGRWPLWRVLGLRRRGSQLRAAVCWLRGGQINGYSLAELSLVEQAVCWRDMASAVAARQALTEGDSATAAPIEHGGTL